MNNKTGIEWTNATWNPVRGCSRVSEGCRNCYAERQAVRFAGPGMAYQSLVKMTSQGPKWTGKIDLIVSKLAEPLRLKDPRRIFVNSMGDLFHPFVPDAFIADVFAYMAVGHWHTYQVLTKHPDRMSTLLNSPTFQSQFEEALALALDEAEFILRRHPLCKDIRQQVNEVLPLPNVWIGVSVENQEAADQRMPFLLKTPAAVRWLSIEPLLGPVKIDFPTKFWTNRDGNMKACAHCCNGDGCDDPSHFSRDRCPYCHGMGKTAPIDWVVVGGESGPKARPMHAQWVRAVRDQCTASGVPFFFKQWGEWAPRHVTPKNTLLPLEKWGWISINGGKIDQTTRPFEDELSHHEQVARLGKKAAGRLLDGREWNEVPA